MRTLLAPLICKPVLLSKTWLPGKNTTTASGMWHVTYLKVQHITNNYKQPLEHNHCHHEISITVWNRTCQLSPFFWPVSYSSGQKHIHLLSPVNTRHARHLITSGKSETAAAVAKARQDITNHPVSPLTVRRALKEHGFKAVTEKKKALLICQTQEREVGLCY